MTLSSVVNGKSQAERRLSAGTLDGDRYFWNGEENAWYGSGRPLQQFDMLGRYVAEHPEDSLLIWFHRPITPRQRPDYLLAEYNIRTPSAERPWRWTPNNSPVTRRMRFGMVYIGRQGAGPPDPLHGSPRPALSIHDGLELAQSRQSQLSGRRRITPRSGDVLYWTHDPDELIWITHLSLPESTITLRFSRNDRWSNPLTRALTNEFNVYSMMRQRVLAVAGSVAPTVDGTPPDVEAFRSHAHAARSVLIGDGALPDTHFTRFRRSLQAFRPSDLTATAGQRTSAPVDPPLLVDLYGEYRRFQNHLVAKVDNDSEAPAQLFIPIGVDANNSRRMWVRPVTIQATWPLTGRKGPLQSEPIEWLRDYGRVGYLWHTLKDDPASDVLPSDVMITALRRLIPDLHERLHSGRGVPPGDDVLKRRVVAWGADGERSPGPPKLQFHEGPSLEGLQLLP